MGIMDLVARVSIAAFVFLAVVQPTDARAAEGVTVSMVTAGKPGPAASHGLKKVTAALETKGAKAEQVATPASARGKTLILAALASDAGPAAELLKTAGVPVPGDPEALVIRRASLGGRPALAVVASDDRGLMYALLDVAQRIGWAPDPNDPLSEVRDAVERPFVPDRALSIYTMHQACFEARLFNEDYWARYFDMLARCRFNRFVLIFGYENWGYFAPPYPYLFDVEEFPGVRVVGITREKQKRNLRALNRMIEMAHERGLEFTVGIWDHVYRGGVQGPGDRARKPTPGIVWGLSEENLVAYTKVALARFLELVPQLDSIQFRMHGESGLRRGEMETFWTNIYRVMKEHGRGMRFDARAKNFPDSLIDKALEMGVPIRICTKYWMEQMGLPFHPTHVHPRNQHDRRHGYADLLRYPKRYDVHWRLWTAGTTRVLLWGDPDYVRRFAQSTHLYDGKGFEVTEPMGTKMQDHPHHLPPFELLRPKYRYYDWEFERYWHFYQVFGRVSYNPNTPPEVWRREFERRFGKEAAPYVERALHRASRILPRAVAYCYPYHHFPTTRGWVARQRQEDLPRYAEALPSDTEQFLSCDEAARYLLEGQESAKITPEQSSLWFADAASDVLINVELAKAHIGMHRSNEFNSTMVDLQMLSSLAYYHACRALAGLNWALYKRSNDLAALDMAIDCEGNAVFMWRKLVAAAGDVYHDDIMMGRRSADLCGHWNDELVRLEAGLKRLRQEKKQYRPGTPKEVAWIAHVPTRSARPGSNLTLKATVNGRDSIQTVRLRCRLGQDEFHNLEMERQGAYLFSGKIPGEKVAKGLSYFIEAVDRGGRKATWPPQGSAAPMVVDVTDDHTAPCAMVSRIDTAPALKPLKVGATVRDPSGVKWVRLRYRSVTQFEDYRTLEMTATGDGDRYEAVVPAEHVVPQWDFMYFIEVMDNHGNGKIYPHLDKEAPYVVVRLEH